MRSNAFRVLVALLLLAVAGGAFAQAVNREDARQVAETWLGARQARGAAPTARILDCQPFTAEGRLLAYRLPLEPAGVIVVSARRALPPIKAFSFETDFDPADDGGVADLLRFTLGESLDLLEARGALAAGEDPAVDRAREAWDRLLAGDAETPRDTPVGPFIASSWHQSAPYKNACPQGDGGICVVGCVATSAAMIMKYWQYPPAGEGSHSYQWGGDDSCGENVGGGILSADFSDPYDWDLILDSYTSGYTAAQAAAAAELNYEVGVAFEMDYGVCASGTYVSWGESVYPDYFRYSTDIDFINRSGHTADGWWARICEELDAFPPRPTHYRINTHSIICDGHQEDAGARYYHMNYGWGGGQNLWYALDEVYCPWSGCDPMVEAMLVNIEPLGYFAVSDPANGEIWTHGDPIPAVHWSGASGSQVVVDLYDGTQFVARLADWTANDGEEIPLGTVQSAWGTGNAYRLKVVGDDLKFGWSGVFGIFGAGAWSEAGGAPLDDGGAGQSASWGDCDGVGGADLYLSNSSSANHLYFGDGVGSFADGSAPPVDVNGFSRGAAWADIDNDGDLDLYLLRTGGETNLLFRNDAGTFTDITAGDVVGDGYSSDLAWGDYDGDGLVDVYVAQVYKPDLLLHNLGDGSFANVAASPLGNAGWGRSANWGDADGDGDLDLYLVRSGTNYFYRNNGDGSFTDATYATGLTDSGNGYGAAWGDADGDGDLDLYIVNDGANRYFRNDGGVFVSSGSGALLDAGAGRSASWVDVDADGRLDLYVVNNGANVLLHNDGGEAFSDATHPLLGDAGNGNAAAWADVDGDGDLDVYLVNAGGPNRLLRNDGVGGHWLLLDLEGTASNRLGIGATVTAVAGGQRVTRTLGGDAGTFSQNAPTLHFGLGSATQVDSLILRWPSGVTQVMTTLAADQHLLVSETVTAVEDAPAPLRLHAAQPNPFNPSTTLRFTLDAPRRVSLAIYDLAGRRVRLLLDGAARPAGESALRFDGRDDAGTPLASGVYLAQLVAEGERESQKLVLLK